MHAMINGQRVQVDLTRPQKLAIASAPYEHGYLLPSCSHETASALVRKGLATRKGRYVRLSPAGCGLREKLRAELRWSQ